MPVLPKFIVTKFIIKSEVVGVYDTLDDAETIRTRCLMRGEPGVKYEVCEVVKDATGN